MNDRHPDQPPPARPTPTRQAVLLGAGAVLVVGLGGAAVSAGNALPGQRAALRKGTVDQSSAQWIAASAANYRYADRPDDYTIDRIVIHVTQSHFTATARAFQDSRHRAAAHYLVRASDGHIAQLVREADMAYHAGTREWNERSIGIEHEGFVDAPDRWFTDAAYRASAELAADISARYGIPSTASTSSATTKSPAPRTPTPARTGTATCAWCAPPGNTPSAPPGNAWRLQVFRGDSCFP